MRQGCSSRDTAQFVFFQHDRLSVVFLRTLTLMADDSFTIHGDLEGLVEERVMIFPEPARPKTE